MADQLVACKMKLSNFLSVRSNYRSGFWATTTKINPSRVFLGKNLGLSIRLMGINGTMFSHCKKTQNSCLSYSGVNMCHFRLFYAAGVQYTVLLNTYILSQILHLQSRFGMDSNQFLFPGKQSLDTSRSHMDCECTPSFFCIRKLL